MFCLLLIIATDKRSIPITVFLFLDKNICCEYSLEASRRGASNEHRQHMFLSRNKKTYKYFLAEKSALSRAMDNCNCVLESRHCLFQISSSLGSSRMLRFEIIWSYPGNFIYIFVTNYRRANRYFNPLYTE